MTPQRRWPVALLRLYGSRDRQLPGVELRHLRELRERLRDLRLSMRWPDRAALPFAESNLQRMFPDDGLLLDGWVFGIAYVPPRSVPLTLI
jgi:hypothetical protein